MTDSLVEITEDKTPGGIFFRRTFTNESKETLALVMGYGGSLRIWPTTFINKLAQKYVVITYDNRGTGQSFVPAPPEEYTIEHMASDLSEVMRHLSVTSHHLLGYSMGSCIALQYAHDFPQFVKSLFLLSGTAGGAFYSKPDKEMSTALANPQGNTLWDIYMSTWKLMFSPEAFEKCQPALTSIYENSKDRPTRLLALTGHSHAFKGFDGTSYLSKIKMPTTVFAGRNDRLMPVQNSHELAKNIAGAELVLINDCEHVPHVQNEDAVVEAIEENIAKAEQL